MPFSRFIKQTPFKGVEYYDIDPLMQSPCVRDIAIQYLTDKVRKYNPTILLGVESRGYGLCAHIAQHGRWPWAMARKAGKTPGSCFQKTYSVEYGETRTIELKKDLFGPADRVVIVDDILATGATAAAMVDIVRSTGATVVACVFVAQIMALDGARKYDVDTVALVKIDKDTVFMGEIVDTPSKNSVYPAVSNSKKVVVMAHPTQQNVAETMVSAFPKHFEHGNISWKRFPDGHPDITFDSNIANRDVLFVGSLEYLSDILEQLMLVRILPRQGVRSLTMYFPYFSMGTMERVDVEGQLATADPLATLLSTDIPMTKTGPATVFVYDIHALQERFYFRDSVRLQLGSHTIKPELQTVIVFPDDGAQKRFGKLYKDYPQIICAKVRQGDKRIVTIKEKINVTDQQHAIIVDDLVQSGGTLYECYLLIKDMFVDVCASVTHAVFPGACYLDFLPGGAKSGLKKFYITDTVPGTVEQIKKLHLDDFFIIKDLSMEFCRNCFPVIVDRSIVDTIAIGSTNKGKVDAVKRGLGPLNKYITVDCESGIPNQPFDYEQILTGARNRALAAFTTATDISVGIESGILPSKMVDVTAVVFYDGRTFTTKYTEETPIPVDHYDLVNLDDQSITFGKRLAERDPTYSHDNWHLKVSGKSRYDTISETVRQLRM